MANIGSKFLYEIESGKKGMSAYTLYNLSKALNVSCDYILTGYSSNGDFEYIIRILSDMSPENLSHVEKIISHISMLK